MKKAFERTRVLLGDDAMQILERAHVAIFGIGGVGGYVTEALARSGVGTLTIVDRDIVSETNLNRQIIATTKTVGRQKTEVMEERLHEINPELTVYARNCFFLPENAGTFDFSQYDYVVDAVDTVTAKLEIIGRAKAAGIPVISSMGTGNKLHPELFRIADIEKTSVCPLARVMRRELKKREIRGVKVLYSTEEPAALRGEVPAEGGKQTVGSVAFVPSAAGLMIAGEVIRELTSGC